MGRLVMEYSSKFLDNQYLKYIGWALYDKSKDVRLAALDAVDALYKAKNFINSLEAFTNRFRWCALGLGDLKRECMLFSCLNVSKPPSRPAGEGKAKGME